MSSQSWQTLGNIVNSAGLTGFAITGATTVVAGYQAYVSPSSSLAASERRLKRARSRLQELSPEEREEIEIRCRASNCKSLKALEHQLKFLTDSYYRLSKGCDEVKFLERHIPYSEFRERVWKLDRDTRGVLNDTLATTVPNLDDMGFDPQNPMNRPSSPESSIAFPSPTIDGDAIPMTRVV